jgi:hypothetical protein
VRGVGTVGRWCRTQSALAARTLSPRRGALHEEWEQPSITAGEATTASTVERGVSDAARVVCRSICLDERKPKELTEKEPTVVEGFICESANYRTS